MKNWTVRLCLVLVFLVSTVSMAAAKRVKLRPRTALKDAKAAISKVADSSDVQVRVAVFEAKLALNRRTNPIIRDGIKSELLPVKQKALERALDSRTRKLLESAVDEVGKLLCSSKPKETAVGRGLEVRIKSKKYVKRLRSILVKCPGSILAEKAKASLINAGGSQGWSLIAKDLADGSDLAKQKKSKQLALQSRSKSAAKWAMKRIHDEDEMGELAREIMIGFAGTRIGRSYVRNLKRDYRRAEKQEDFARRLRLAMILGNLSGVGSVQKTLFAAFSPDYKAPKGITNTQARAWKGLRNVRKLKLLNRDISKRAKLKVRDLFCQVKTDEEAEAAYRWLYDWTRKSQSSKLYAILEKCFYSDHMSARTAAIKTLSKLGNRKNMKLFEEALKESNQEIKQAGARGIAAVASKGDEARLGKLLQREKDEDGKLALIEGLKRLGTPESIRPLKFMVFRQPKSVTLAAINAMASTKDVSIAKNIAALKTSPDDEIRTTVWRHLLSLDAEKYGPSFVSGSKAWLEPRHVQFFGSISEIPLSVFAAVAKSASSEVSAEALKVLARGGDDGASHILDTIENHRDEKVAAKALALLGTLRKKASLNYYTKMVDHESGQVRSRALNLMAKYGSKRKHLPIAMKKRSDKDIVTSLAAHLATYKLSKKRR